MEKVLMKMEADPLLIDWSSYAIAAKGYLKAGDIEKANKSLKKCEHRLMGKREKLGIDMLITLYTSMGNKDDVYRIWNKYKKKVKRHNSSYHCMIRGLENLDGAEEIFAEWETNRFNVDWSSYAIAAKGNLKAGDIEKANESLKKCEHRLMGKREKLGIDMLITLYTSMGNKDDVYHIWNKYKKKVKRQNSSYHCMIRGLEKLDDLDGAEEIFAEWETNRVHFDIRIPNLLRIAYCKKGHMDKAISTIEQLEESGKHPNGSTWNRLALGYCVQNDMDKAVDTMKKAILASQPGWKPHFHSLASCVKYLQSKGDTQGEEELKDLLRVRGLCSKKFERGLDKYIEFGNRKSEAYSTFLVRMVKLVQQSWWKFRTCFLRVSSSYSTETETLASLFLANKDEQCLNPLTSSPKNALYSRLLYLTRSKESVISVLDKWVTEQNPIKYEDLQIIVRQFRAYRRYNHALQIFEWIKKSKDFDISPRDFAVELDLVSKAHGLEAAETYFTSIPDDLRTYQVYGALLNCYADAKVLKKAEDTMQKLKELAYAGTVAYNVMMTLYAKLGYLEKLQSLMLEMEDKGISGDAISYNILLNAYASVPDVTEMEKVLMKMEVDPLLIDWSPYTVVAKGYLKAGDIEKASESLKKCENRLKGKREKLGIDMLITLYTSMGKKDDVYRTWNKYNKKVKHHNSSYHCMIRGLEKLDDLDGAEKIFAEWETNRVHFDIRIPNLLISAYCKKGHMEKAISIIEQLEESGKHPNGSSWNRLALGYCVQNDMEKAVETMKKAILASKPGWKPHFHSLASCVKYLQSKGDTQGEEELKDLLRVRGLCSKEFERGLDKYIEIGNRKSEALNETDLEDTC
ncbi:pentatricopeptide repeat-containing protein At2g20710, mitochondrial-like [Solanum stenotomum]|uniref:pentatricopeptide repeat-containing protein At2g20710, mitochondrial-like n=1 Tax=Solanum stenotomum TaxID=172797 RepID=UPI0020D0496D|nr:pentatricopeptide repeat-containing protein At2g20710, mitochondrial-like [Solanum stenotomum]